jgi:hypothetical protein
MVWTVLEPVTGLGMRDQMMITFGTEVCAWSLKHGSSTGLGKRTDCCHSYLISAEIMTSTIVSFYDVELIFILSCAIRLLE